MKVYDYIRDRRAKVRLHMALLDPDKQTPEEAGRLAKDATKAGTDAIMVGGSTGVTQDLVDATVLAIKKASKVPVVLFPASAGNLSRHADALYFMSLLNSKDARFIVGEQRRAAKAIRGWGLETISMAYLVVAPGMRAGVVGRAEPIPRDKPGLAADYALTAEMFGMQLVYLEAGSGAPDPVPPAMVRAVRDAIRVPLVVGGGIRTATQAGAIARAGADVVVTGTIVEVARDEGTLRKIVEAVKAAG